MSNFHIGEVCILNSNALKGLPSRIGERVVIDDVYYISPNYDWIIEFDDGELAPVKSSELTKLTKKDTELMNYIFTNNKVKCLEEEVTILTVDYLNGQAEVQFDDKSVTVVDFNKLIEIEDDTLPVLDFSNEQTTSRTQLHRNVIEEIHTVFKIKNSDYGNSFGEQYEEHGLLSAIIRLDDKMRRLKQLNKQTAQVKDESIRDTVLDLANYAIMTVMELDKN